MKYLLIAFCLLEVFITGQSFGDTIGRKVWLDEHYDDGAIKITFDNEISVNQKINICFEGSTHGPPPDYKYATTIECYHVTAYRLYYWLSQKEFFEK